MNPFSDSYEDAFLRFKISVSDQGYDYSEINLSFAGDLKIGIGYKGSKTPENLYIHSSGLHGVEAFTGSAVQLALMDQINIVKEGVGVLLIHVINPYGMKYLRRVNENNIDLNRNFIDLQEELPANLYYDKLKSLLNPTASYQLHFFKLRAMYKILINGYYKLKQAVGQGQYDYPECLFYGGNAIEEGPSQLIRFLQKTFPDPKQIRGIDLHCGLGTFGEENLFLESCFDENIMKKLSFLNKKIHYVSAKDRYGYQISGGWIQRLKELWPQAEFEMLTQEFGTYKPLKVLQGLRKENFTHHYASGSILDENAKRELKNIFIPESEEWRHSVIQKGTERFLQMINHQ